ncbi:HAD family hydrolase [Leucobacter salsicius]|uniref:HAD family hydrolase n=1 Tax=Leucobacter salsicius TaxID=664638 RepID=UPI00034BA225|nr:HAD family hydrolase [Leucobacter salsicius]
MIDRFDAHLFDLDGVITPTVVLHRRAWRETFNELFNTLGLAPYREDEYFSYLDGLPRFAGVATLLAARGIELPDGEPGDTGLHSIMGLGNLKNERFGAVLERDGIEAYPGSLVLLHQLALAGKPLGIVSSSRNAEQVLRAAGIHERFGAIVDGERAAAEGLPGKPSPDTFVRGAELLGFAPAQIVVYEDAESGVTAARAGNFGLVVGVDRGAGRSALERAGAHVVVADLEELAA